MGVRDAIRAWRDRRAARTYAPLLLKRLMADYGAGETYTVAQVRAAMGRVGVPQSLAAAGYAAFVSEADFDDFPGVHGPYQELRSVMRSRLGDGPVQAWVPAAENPYAFPGGHVHEGSL